MKNALKYIVSAVVSLLIIAYIIYHVVNSFGTSVETQPAQLVSVRETLSGDGYIFRDETLLYSNSAGGASYAFNNGELVFSGAKIADIYSGSNVEEIKSQIAKIDKQISIIQNSSVSGNALLTDSKSMDLSISSLYYTMIGKMIKNEPDYVIRRSDDLLILLNKRQIVLKAVADFSSRISELQSQKATLTASLNSISETVWSPSSGYFYNEADGYENIFSSSKIDSLTYKDFENLTKTQPDPQIINSQNVIGKLMNKHTWYVAMSFKTNQIAGFNVGDTYTLVFPYNSEAELSMKLYQIVQDTESDNVLLIFQSGSVPENFNFLRMQSVDVVKNTYKGYRVPISAVRIVNGKKGVYILNGNVVEFKLIDSLVEIGGNLIVSEQDKLNDENYQTKLGFYDQIITKGKNLYEHKVIG